MAPSTPENLELSDLPQFFADMHGWEELASEVSKAARDRRVPIESAWPKLKHFQ